MPCSTSATASCRRERDATEPWRPRALACLLVALCLMAPGGCPSRSGDPEAELLRAEVAELRETVAELSGRLERCEVDDRFLFSEGVLSLEVGEYDAACPRFEELLVRYPTSPLVPFSEERLKECRRRAAEASKPAPGADSGPLEVQRAWLEPDRYGVPLAKLRLVNRTERTVSSYKVALRLYDEAGAVLRHLTKGSEWFVAQGVARGASPGAAFRAGPWPLSGYLSAARMEVVVLSVDFTDGTTWKRDSE